MRLADVVEASHVAARSKGWWPQEELDSPPVGMKLALIHSEISEALEAYREAPEGKEAGWWISDTGKPEGFVSELADALIRIGDLLVPTGTSGEEFERVVALKMAYNASRPHRHGGKRA